MSKRKSITLLTIISIVMAIIIVLTFARFPIGVKNYNSALGAIELDYDIEGGVAYTLTLASDNEEEVEDVDAVIGTLKDRLNALGYTAYTIKAVKSTDTAVEDYDIRIELKNTDSVATDVSAVASYGKVKFYGGSAENPTTEILTDMNVIEDSQYLGLAAENNHMISLVFKADAKKELIKLISAQDTYYLKITCGENASGEENVLFNTSIKEDAFVGNTLGISGFTVEADAQRSAMQMRSGGLNYKYEVSEGVAVQSPYGENVALKMAVAIMTLVIVIIAMLLILYKGLGLIASLSTILFIFAETWLMIGVPGIVVSMGGIVGIIASTILCAYGMVILAQRVKDEYANSERTVKSAVNKGFIKSLVPTISVHVIAGIVALALLVLTGGVIQNFAMTFGIGVAVSLICTLVFTRMFTALILPLVSNKEKFLRFKRASKVEEE